MSLATLRIEREIDPNPAKPGDFGLDAPAAEIPVHRQGPAAPRAAGRQEPDRPVGLRPARGQAGRRAGAGFAAARLPEARERLPGPDGPRVRAGRREGAGGEVAGRPGRHRRAQGHRQLAARRPRRGGGGQGADSGPPREAEGGEDQGLRDRAAQDARPVRPGAPAEPDPVDRRGEGPGGPDAAARQGGAREEGRLRPARGDPDGLHGGRGAGEGRPHLGVGAPRQGDLRLRPVQARARGGREPEGQGRARAGGRRLEDHRAGGPEGGRGGDGRPPGKARELRAKEFVAEDQSSSPATASTSRRCASRSGRRRPRSRRPCWWRRPRRRTWPTRR